MEVKEVILKACHTLMPRLEAILRFRKVSTVNTGWHCEARLGIVGML